MSNKHSIFISYSQHQEAWVDNTLAPRLKDAGLWVIKREELPAGTPKLDNIEYAIKSSGHTVAVISPDWMNSEWNAFEALLIRTSDPAARKRKLIPIIFENTDLPELLESLDSIDFRSEKNRGKKIDQLIRTIKDQVFIPAPWKRSEPLLLKNWSEWLWRYRKPILSRFLLFLLISIIALASLQVYPFQPRLGWNAISPKLKGARLIYDSDKHLLVSTSTDYHGCHSDPDDKGLWQFIKGSQEWKKIDSQEFCFNTGDINGRTHITGFSSLKDSSKTNHIYATSYNNGLLKSSEKNLNQWSLVSNNKTPRNLENITISNINPYSIFVSSDKELYRSQDMGKNWSQVKLYECEKNKEIKGFKISSLLSNDTGIYMSSTQDLDLGFPEKNHGLYFKSHNRNCWEKAIEAQGKYIYKNILLIPSRKNELLIHTKNIAATIDEKEHQIWHYIPEKNHLTSLWKGFSLTSIFSNGGHWYAVDANGAVTRGQLDSSSNIESLPRINQCLIKGCIPQFILNPLSKKVILLANEKAYSLEEVSWHKLILP